MWYIYIVKCSDKTLYTGITKDIKRRLVEHNSNDLGAKYTRGRRPVNIVYQRTVSNRSSALQEEARIKAMTRKQKNMLTHS